MRENNDITVPPNRIVSESRVSRVITARSGSVSRIYRAPRATWVGA